MDTVFTIIIVAAFFAGVAVGAIFVTKDISNFEKEAIKNNVAYYDQKTAKFTFKKMDIEEK